MNKLVKKMALTLPPIKRMYTELESLRNGSQVRKPSNVDINSVKNVKNIYPPIPEHWRKEMVDEIDGAISAYAESSYLERAFLNGLILQKKPVKILELGVSAGGNTAVILNALNAIKGVLPVPTAVL